MCACTCSTVSTFCWICADLQHALDIPAVVVVLISLEWDEEHWDEREKECAATFETLRSGPVHA